MSLLFEFDDTNEPEHIELFNAFCNKNKRTIKQINSLERKLNIMLSNLNDYLNQDNISLDYFNETRTEILQRINELDHVYETYIDMLSDLTMITDENLHHLETKHITYVNNIKTKLSRMKTQIVPDTILNTNESLSSTHSEGHFAKLPAIHIPNFDGTDRVQFQDFFALFISIIDKRSDINDMSKLMYLKSYLKGNALKVISSLALTDSNYTKAKQLLTMEYDDPNLKIATLIDQLINFSTHDSILAPDLLEKLVRTRSYIYELQNTGVDILNGHASATIIARIIFSRCPDYFRRALYQKLLTYYPTLQEILDNFSEILRQQVEYEPERYTKYERSNLPRTITKTQFVRPERNTNTSTVSSLSEFNKRPTSEIKCSFCSSTQHVATACHTYPTFQSRLRKLQTSNRCVRCTREGHSASQCTRIIKYPCSICKSFKHFTPMCDDNEDTRRTQQHMISPEAVTFNESIIENESKGNHSTKTTNDSADTKRSKSTKFLTEFNRKYRNNTLLSAQTNSNGHNLLPLVLVEIKNDKNTRYRLCFMWKHNNETVYYRFKVLPWGLSCSPFVLNYILQFHFERNAHVYMIETIKNSFYVDNFITSVATSEQAIQLFDTTRELLSDGGFNLRDWNSNLPAICEKAKKLDVASNTGNTEMVLGYRYDTLTDTLSIPDFKIQSNCNTKRTILSMYASIFDPMGYFAPVLMRGKLFIRKLWQLGNNWDTRLDPKTVHDWKVLCESFAELKQFMIPRFNVVIDDNSECKLIIFCDANNVNYGFCAYLVSGTKSLLLFSKNRQAPIKGHSTVPRLELMAVVLATKCTKTLLQSLKSCNINDIYLFTDSQITLNRILTKETANETIFVRNRINQIHETITQLTNEFNIQVRWRYVKSEHNPADLVTKGISIDQFKYRLEFWFYGSEFIILEPKIWPVNELPCIKSEFCSQLNLVQPINENKTAIEITKYSNFGKLLRVTTNVFEFINKLRKRQVDSKTLAYNYLITQAQTNKLSHEIDYLRNPRGQPPNLVNQLNLYLDDENFVRCKGRIDKCTRMANIVKDPILLPKNDHVTNLLIMYYHEKLLHLGLSTTVYEIRKCGFWIPSIRTNVKNVIKNCMLCKRMNAFAYKYPRMTNLTKTQTHLVKPFHYIGFDFTSHVYINDPNTNTKRKMYVFIITCLNTRAINLDLLDDMSTSSVLMSLRRHFARFCVPRIIFSDNQTSFIASGHELEKALASSDYNELLNRHAIKHVRIPVYSSWIGTAWERMLRIVKQCLYKTVKRNTLTYFEFFTLLQEIADAINNRPLTYYADDVNFTPLTPNNFIKPAHTEKLVMDETQPYYETNENEYRNSIAKIQDLYNQFKKRWYDEYLISLREQSSKIYQSPSSNRIKENDVVLIRDPTKPRIMWQLGCVTETITGCDGKIRSVKLRKADRSITHHSITNLYPMELSITHNVPLVDQQDFDDDIPAIPEDNPPIPSRPKRKTATKSQQLWRTNINDL